MRQHVEQVALLGVDDFLHLGELVGAEAGLGQPRQQHRPRIGWGRLGFRRIAGSEVVYRDNTAQDPYGHPLEEEE